VHFGRLADRIDERLVGDVIDAADKAFIESLDMFFLATADELGRPNCSYKGGEPGFVRVVALGGRVPVGVGADAAGLRLALPRLQEARLALTSPGTLRTRPRAVLGLLDRGGAVSWGSRKGFSEVRRSVSSVAPTGRAS
jgi:hypothetical protein